jgi:hypothetical protein
LRHGISRLTSLTATALLIAACGGGGGGGGTPAPTADGGGQTPGGTPSTAPDGGGQTPGGTPSTAPGGGGQTPGATPAPEPSAGTVPSIASLPAGLQTGGTTSKSPSGYSDQLLTGRWRQDFGPFDNCVTIPASSQCNQEYSLELGQGFSATNLSATAINELTVFRGAQCAPANRLGTVRVAQAITLEAADTPIPDDTVSPSGTIAVRRGLVTDTTVDTSGFPNAEAVFAQCSALEQEPTPDTPETCVDSVSLRIEAGADGKPVLLLEQETACLPGTTPPAPGYTARWSFEQGDGLTKLP